MILERKCHARAYRDGRCVCQVAEVAIGQHTRRVGLTPHERRYIKVRFVESVSPDLRAELEQLSERRGMVAERLAERLDPVTLIVDDAHEEPMEITVHLQPPQIRRLSSLRQVEYDVREEPA